MSHIDNHFQTLAMRHELDTVPATAPARMDYEAGLDLAKQQAAASHASAATIMHDYNATKRPFGLFLRSFESEAYDYLTPEDADSQRKVLSVLSGPSNVEAKLIP